VNKQYKICIQQLAEVIGERENGDVNLIYVLTVCFAFGLFAAFVDGCRFRYVGQGQINLLHYK
jgi:hypothetical protein